MMGLLGSSLEGRNIYVNDQQGGLGINISGIGPQSENDKVSKNEIQKSDICAGLM